MLSGHIWLPRWINNYLDIQEYVTKILGFRKSLSLKNALKALKIKVNEDSLHDALNDIFIYILGMW